LTCMDARRRSRVDDRCRSHFISRARCDPLLGFPWVDRAARPGEPGPCDRLESARGWSGVVAASCQDGVVIVWINGAFGVGKTTTAGLLAKRLDDAKVFDPEYVGFMLRPFVETPTGDFQDLPLWRCLVVETMTGLVRHWPHTTWIAPMSLINRAYRAEVLDGIRAAGVELREVVLVVSEAQLRARIDADRVETVARQWRQDHVAQAVAAFDSLTDACFIDASRAPEMVVDAVLERI
jgi:hypothetical protein